MLNNTHICFIALGSNQNNPKTQVIKAIKNISLNPEIKILVCSKLYQTEPYGYINQDNFINAVIKITTTLSPSELLIFLHSIEKKQARVKTMHWGPRTIDLDILVYDNLVINTPDLTIPHPDLQNRLFVLEPWVQITPDWCLPNGQSIYFLYQKLIMSV